MATRIEETIALADKFRDRQNDLKAISEAFRHGDILVRNYNAFLANIKTLIDSGDETTYTKQDFDDLLDMRNAVFGPIMQNLSFIQQFERYNPEIPVIIPDINPATQILGERYYDEVNGVYTYYIIDRTIILEDEKKNLFNTLYTLCDNIINLHDRVLLFTSNGITNEMIELHRSFYSVTKQEIEALTVETVTGYSINMMVYENIINQLKALL